MSEERKVKILAGVFIEFQRQLIYTEITKEPDPWPNLKSFGDWAKMALSELHELEAEKR